MAIDNLNDSTINFLVCAAGISFGLAGLTGAYEIFRRIAPSEEYQKIFHSIVLIAGIITLASLLPLVLNETSLYLAIPSYWLFFTCSATYVFLVFQLLTKQVRLYSRRIAIVLYFCTGLLIFFIPLNIHTYKSIVFFKLLILWGTFILSYRFFLFVRLISIEKSSRSDLSER